jgi:Predicted phage phi-C31 gp36 major capsid-like protein
VNIQKRLQEIEARKIELRNMLENDEKADLDAVEKELKSLAAEEQELRRRLEVAAGIQAGGIEGRKIDSTGLPAKGEARDVDSHDTMEYRRAFMEYVTRGKKSDVLEFRADETTLPSDIGAVIPTTIINRIVEKMEEVGRIWSRVTKTSIQGGVEIPVSTAKPTAVWLAAGQVAEKQKKVVNAKISFSYHKLQVRVAVELVAGTVALPVFEATVADNIAEAMVKALDAAIISGTGTGQPLGIANHNVSSSRVATLSPEEFGKYETWPAVFAKVPRSYRSGVALIMNDADWHKYIVGMTDTTGQPIARVNYGLDGTIEERFLGREVIAVEDLLPSIDEADAGEVVGILVRLSDYMVNSNMAITYRRYFDENTDEWISKATMIADGKLADPNGVVLIKKAAS